MKNKPLLTLTRKDFRVDTFRVSGHGGQKVNKTESGVRITHIKTSIFSTCTRTRSQSKNKKEAFTKLCNDARFKMWLKQKSLGILTTKEKIEKQLKETMKPENLRTEVRKNKKWAKDEI